MRDYYNEIDPYAAEWLRNLIAEGHLPDGYVDERSIEDVHPNELLGFRHCHFFAGIGIWALALQRSGFGSEKRIWTGSCPCQPFSSTGKGGGFDDERHLWPAWHHLIRECEPDVVFGEQVASKDGLAWLDLVQADMEGTGYAGGAVDICAAGFGAPHIRQRQYLAFKRLGNASGSGLEGYSRNGNGRHQSRWIQAEQAGYAAEAISSERVANCDADGCAQGGGDERGEAFAWGKDWHDNERCGSDGRMGNADSSASRWDAGSVSRAEEEGCGGRIQDGNIPVGSQSPGAGVGRLANSSGSGEKLDAGDVHEEAQIQEGWSRKEHGPNVPERGGENHGRCGDVRSDGVSDRGGRPCPTNGFWSSVDWLFCRDGKWRPAQSGTFPLADGDTSRVGKLRAYGNAIAAPQAQEFIEAFADIID